MFNIQKMIGSKVSRRFAICTLSLCLAIPALSIAASYAARAARLDGLLLASSGGIIINSVEIIFPKPTPPPDEDGLTVDGEKKA